MRAEMKARLTSTSRRLSRKAKSLLGRSEEGPADEGPARTGFDRLLTQTDLESAYRLLLGRDLDANPFLRSWVGRCSIRELSTALLSSEEFRIGPLHKVTERSEREDLTIVDTPVGRFFVSPHDMSNVAVAAGSEYESHVVAAIREAVGPGATFCDIGANIGHHTVVAARAVGPTGRVLAFEASAGNANLVQANTLLNGCLQVEVQPFALADRRQVFRYIRAQGTNGYLAPVHPGEVPDDGESIEFVQAFRLDDLAVLVGRVDAIKLDVEGSEGLVLDGARALIERDRPILLTELAEVQLLHRSSMDASEYLGRLQRLGYEFEILEPGGAVVGFGDDVEALVAVARAGMGLVDVRCSVPAG